ncbi:MAG: hypothetical protein Q7J01_04535, partial [Syntrophales bacterium]|nr:hypothetical protein [Syntrophales bacterium]
FNHHADNLQSVNIARSIMEEDKNPARITAVACPSCAKMLTDAVKIEELDDRLEVLSIAEIVLRAR